jgi:hypothetical protein
VNRPFPNHCDETLLNVYGSYHLARMQSDPVLRDLAPAFAEAQRSLAERAKEYAASQIRLMTALGRLDSQPASAPAGERRAALEESERAKSNAEDAFASLELERICWFRAYRTSFREMQLRLCRGERYAPARNRESSFSETGLRLIL